MTKIETNSSSVATGYAVSPAQAAAPRFSGAMREAQVLPRSAYVPSGEPYDRDKHGSHRVGDVELVPGAPGYDFDRALPRLKEIAATDRQLASYLSGKGIELAPNAAQTQVVDEVPILIADPALAAELDAINKSIEPSGSGGEVRQQTAELFQTKMNQAPDKFQLDYWAGIFGLDNQITPDEIDRLSLAASIVREAAALSETALTKQTRVPTTEITTVEAKEATLLENNADKLAPNLNAEEVLANAQNVAVQATAESPMALPEVQQSVAIDTADTMLEQPVNSQPAEDLLASASEPSVESSLMQAQANLIMTSAQYLSQQISLNQAQLLDEGA